MTTVIFALAIAGGAALTLTAAQAQAQATCATRTTVVERLSNTFGETRQSIGLGANNAVVEVFASDKTGTWTITVTMANGQTCLLASGKAFETLAEDTVLLPGKGT